MCAISAGALGAGCADVEPSADELASEEGEGSSLALQAPSSQVTVPDPKGAYFADVKAAGTGCRPGLWDVEIGEDGKTFTMYFHDYQSKVDENTQVSIKDCTLAIKLRSPAGMSYTITDFYYEGYAWLEEGVMARQTASYYFQGVSTLQTEKRTDLVGPYDDSYVFNDKVGTADLVWSPCGIDRMLNVKTLLRVSNGNPRRTGYMNLATVNASTDSKIVLKLDYRKCPTTTTPSTPVSGGGRTPSRGGR